MTATDSADSAPLNDLPGTELATLLASRLCHDFISPASAIISGLDLLDDPQAADMRDDAMALIGGSARKLVDLLQFSRVAFGSGADSYGREELEALAKGVFAHHRGELALTIAPDTLDKAAAKALLNIAAAAAAALPMGGTATIAVEPGERGWPSSRNRPARAPACAPSCWPGCRARAPAKASPATGSRQPGPMPWSPKPAGPWRSRPTPTA